VSAEADQIPALTIFSPMFTDFSEEGRIAENDWYDTDHVPQRLGIPGFLSATRFERLAVQPSGVEEVAPLRYINAYRVTHPAVVEEDPYRLSYQHLTPRSRFHRDFPVSPPIYRDVWELVHAAGALATDDGARVLLLTADEPGGSVEDAEEFLRSVAVPTLLSAPGVLRSFVFRRADVQVAMSDGVHAPRFLTASVLSGAEVAARPSLGERLAAIAERSAASGNAVARAWVGVYDRRPSPWTTRPAAETAGL
jgi:hypothetical protein